MTARSPTPPGHFGPCPPHFGVVPLAVSAIFLRDPIRIWSGFFTCGLVEERGGGVVKLTVRPALQQSGDWE